MMRALAFVVLSSLFAPLAASAQDDDGAPSLVAALTEAEVRVTSRFAGAEIVIYGVAHGLADGDDVIVVVRGPDRAVLVMQKERRFGVWINSAPARFEGAPSYYATASTRRLGLIAPPDNLRRFGVGAEHAPLRAVGSQAASVSSRIAEYRRAIIRMRGRDGLFRDEPAGVEVLEGELFRAAVTLPPGSPTGDYRADVFLYRNGRSVAQRSVELHVVKAGLERVVYNFAHERPALYGLLAVFLAIASGSAAAAVFGRR